MNLGSPASKWCWLPWNEQVFTCCYCSEEVEKVTCICTCNNSCVCVKAKHCLYLVTCALIYFRTNLSQSCCFGNGKWRYVENTETVAWPGALGWWSSVIGTCSKVAKSCFFFSSSPCCELASRNWFWELDNLWSFLRISSDDQIPENVFCSVSLQALWKIWGNSSSALDQVPPLYFTFWYQAALLEWSSSLFSIFR